MEQIIKRINSFVSDRNWNQFHSPDNLAKSIVIEAAELLECFQWGQEEIDIEHVKEEIADVLIYCIQLTESLNLNITDIINKKMDKNEIKYPL